MPTNPSFLLLLLLLYMYRVVAVDERNCDSPLALLLCYVNPCTAVRNNSWCPRLSNKTERSNRSAFHRLVPRTNARATHTHRDTHPSDRVVTEFLEADASAVTRTGIKQSITAVDPNKCANLWRVEMGTMRAVQQYIRRNSCTMSPAVPICLFWILTFFMYVEMKGGSLNSCEYSSDVASYLVYHSGALLWLCGFLVVSPT